MIATLLCVSLLSYGCVPVAGDIEYARSTAPVKTPLAQGEKVVILAGKPDGDSEDAVPCVRDETEAMLPQGAMVDPAEFRTKIGDVFVSPDAVSGEKLEQLAQNEQITSNIRKSGVRFIVLVTTSFKSNFTAVYGLAGGEHDTEILAHILDLETRDLSDRLMVSVTGITFLWWGVGVIALTEWPACKHMAALITSLITGKPIEDLDPEIVPLIEKSAAAAQAKEQAIQWCRDQFPDYPCSEAREFLEICREAVSGDPVSMFRVANWLKKGIHPVKEDPVAAYVWFGRARTAGNLGIHTGATDYSLERLRRTLTVGQLTEAENRLLSSNVNLTECAVELETAEGS